MFNARIYALTDNDDNVFYVGCTLKSLNNRLIQHISATKTHDGWANSRKNQKIRSLNYQVKIKELESFAVVGKEKREAQRNAAAFENKWINKFLKDGVELTNCTIPKQQRQKGNTKAA